MVLFLDAYSSFLPFSSPLFVHSLTSPGKNTLFPKFDNSSSSLPIVALYQCTSASWKEIHLDENLALWSLMAN